MILTTNNRKQEKTSKYETGKYHSNKVKVIHTNSQKNATLLSSIPRSYCSKWTEYGNNQNHFCNKKLNDSECWNTGPHKRLMKTQKKRNYFTVQQEYWATQIKLDRGKQPLDKYVSETNIGKNVRVFQLEQSNRETSKQNKQYISAHQIYSRN